MKTLTRIVEVRREVADAMGLNTYVYLPWAKGYCKVRGEDLVRLLKDINDEYKVPFERVMNDGKISKLHVG